VRFGCAGVSWYIRKMREREITVIARSRFGLFLMDRKFSPKVWYWLFVILL